MSLTVISTHLPNQANMETYTFEFAAKNLLLTKPLPHDCSVSLEFALFDFATVTLYSEFVKSDSTKVLPINSGKRCLFAMQPRLLKDSLRDKYLTVHCLLGNERCVAKVRLHQLDNLSQDIGTVDLCSTNDGQTRCQVEFAYKLKASKLTSMEERPRNIETSDLFSSRENRFVEISSDK